MLVEGSLTGVGKYCY